MSKSDRPDRSGQSDCAHDYETDYEQVYEQEHDDDSDEQVELQGEGHTIHRKP